MSSSTSPKPSYHLCPDFSISPPPDGHLTLGSIVKNLDVDGVAHPLNLKCEIEIEKNDIYPRTSPDSKLGFTRTLKELRALEGSIWAQIFSLEGLLVSLGFLRQQSDDETLMVDDIQTRYFSPTEEYISRSLEVPNVAGFVNVTKNQLPIYMVTGLKVAYGAKLSKETEKTTKIEAKATVSDPHGQVPVGSNVGYDHEDSAAVAFTGSKPFVLGIRVRKIWWEKRVRRTSDKVVGSTLGDDGKQKKTMENQLEMKFLNDFSVENGASAGSKEVYTNHVEDLGMEISDWIL